MPMPVVLTNRIVRELSACRQSSYIQGLLPDGKAQVTVEYENGNPVRLDSVVVSCQHTEDKNLKKLEAEIRKKVLLPALRLLPPDEDTKIFINPSGRFVCGGMDADTGLTGRKLMVDSYGSMVPHGGGAFSGKDCSKVDRSAAYMARYIAKNIVAAGLASKCQVSLAYAIGVPRFGVPLSSASRFTTYFCIQKNRRTGFPIRRQTVYLPNKSLCVPVRASVSTRTSSSMR